MDELVRAIIELDNKNVIDYIIAFSPVVLSIAIIVQSFCQNRANQCQQKKIHEQNLWMQNQNNILKIYGMYYEFNRVIYDSNIYFEMQWANDTAVYNKLNDIWKLRNDFGITLDLARLLFDNSDKDLYLKIEERYNLAIEIIDKCNEYLQSGKMTEVKNKAWEDLSVNPILKFNYPALFGVQEKRDALIKLCRSDEFVEIDILLKKYRELHSYSEYDVYFKKYISLKVEK